MFSKDGWTFKRSSDGHVIINVNNPETNELRVAAVFTAETWAEIVASVSKSGADEFAKAIALEFHNMSIEDYGASASVQDNPNDKRQSEGSSSNI